MTGEIEKLIEELKKELLVSESNLEYFKINDVLLRLNEEINYYKDETLEIKHKLIKILENDNIVIYIVESTKKSDYFIATEIKRICKIYAKFKKYVDKEYYKKVKRYENEEYIIEHRLDLKVNNKEELKEFLKQHKNDKRVLTRVLLSIDNNEELKKALNIKDRNELYEIFKSIN